MNIVIYSIILLGYMYGFYLLFPRAGRQAWEGLIPFYNFFILCKVIKKPWYWAALLILPGVNVLMLMVMNSNLATVFGKRELSDQIKAIFLPFVFFPLWGREGLEYVGPIDRTQVKKSTAREWGDAIIFAVVAASIIRTYFLEAFTIPTGSMEKTLLIGDYLFVSKMAYGPKVPQTPLSFPFAHHTLPGTEIPSYLKWMELPYYRLPGFGSVERNDIVVFNYPEGDTVCVELQSNKSYNAVMRDYVELFGKKHAREFIWNGIPAKFHRAAAVNELRNDLAAMRLDMNVINKIVERGFDITIRPIDKREHYIKRCVGVPGDEIYIENDKLFVNGETAYIPPQFQYRYTVTAAQPLGEDVLKDEFDVNYQDQAGRAFDNFVMYNIPLTLEARAKLDADPRTTDVRLNINPKNDSLPGYYIFPNRPGYDWTEDNWGPLSIPAKGTSVDLNLRNLPYYERIIRVYEGHDLRVKDGQIFIDGAAASSYTFEMDYYFMMGDSRHNSADSRFWGFVPENHIVGRAAFVWLSMDPEKTLFNGKLRFSRMFRIPE